MPADPSSFSGVRGWPLWGWELDDDEPAIWLSTDGMKDTSMLEIIVTGNDATNPASIEITPQNEPERPDARIWAWRPWSFDDLPKPQRWMRDPRVGVLVQSLASFPRRPATRPPDDREPPADIHLQDHMAAVADQLASWGRWWTEFFRLAGRDAPLAVTYHPNGLGQSFIPMGLGDDLHAAAEQVASLAKALRKAILDHDLALPSAFHLDIEGVPGTAHAFFEAVRLGEDLERLGLEAAAAALDDAGADRTIRLRSATNEHLIDLVGRLSDQWRAEAMDRCVWPGIINAFGPGARRSNYETAVGPLGLAWESIVAYRGDPEKPDAMRTLDQTLSRIKAAERLGAVWVMHWDNERQHPTLREPRAFERIAGATLAGGGDLVLFDEGPRDWSDALRLVPR